MKMLIKDILLDLPARQRFDFGHVHLSAKSIYAERVKLRSVVDEAIDCWWPLYRNGEMDIAAWQRTKEKSSSPKRLRIEEDGLSGVGALATGKRDESPPKMQKTQSKNSIVRADSAMSNKTKNTKIRLTHKEQPPKGEMQKQKSEGKSNSTAIEISSASEASDEL